jgi:hypothetical protein
VTILRTQPNSKLPQCTAVLTCIRPNPTQCRITAAPSPPCPKNHHCSTTEPAPTIKPPSHYRFHNRPSHRRYPPTELPPLTPEATAAHKTPPPPLRVECLNAPPPQPSPLTPEATAARKMPPPPLRVECINATTNQPPPLTHNEATTAATQPSKTITMKDDKK